MRIELANPEDLGAIRAIYAPYVLGSAVSFEFELPSIEELGCRMAETLRHAPWLVARQEGEVIGYAYGGLHRARAAYRWSVDVSVYVGVDHHRQGIGRALHLRLFALLRAQGFVNAFAGVTLPNPGSVGLHESLGFRPVGVFRHVGYKLGAWHDVGWWQLELQPAGSAPQPLKSVAEAMLSAAGD